MIAVRSEALKWVGLAAMLVDHAARFLHVNIAGWVWIGRWAFPCFAVALGLQCPPDRRLSVAFRLFGCAALVFPVLWYVSGVEIMPVLATLGLGLVLAFALGLRGPSGVAVGAVLSLSIFSASFFVEYRLAGVLVVAGVSLLSDRDGSVVVGAALLLAGVCGLAVLGGAPVVLAFALVAVYCASGGVEVPRLKGVFMNAYCLQWAPLVVARLGLFS
jgi:hypothetical protein